MLQADGCREERGGANDVRLIYHVAILQVPELKREKMESLKPVGERTKQTLCDTLKVLSSERVSTVRGCWEVKRAHVTAAE